MLSSENGVIAAAMVAGLSSLGALAVVEAVIGLPEQWAFVVAFVLLISFGVVLPQLYLLTTDRSVSRTARLGVVTLVLIVLAAGFSEGVTGTELAVIWALVGISVALIVVSEARDGYRRSVRSEDQ